MDVINFFTFCTPDLILYKLQYISKTWYEASNNENLWKFHLESYFKSLNFKKQNYFIKGVDLKKMARVIFYPYKIQNDEMEKEILDKTLPNLENLLKKVPNSKSKVITLNQLKDETKNLSNLLESMIIETKQLSDLNQNLKSTLYHHYKFQFTKNSNDSTLDSKFIAISTHGVCIFFHFYIKEVIIQGDSNFEDDFDSFHDLYLKFSEEEDPLFEIRKNKLKVNKSASKFICKFSKEFKMKKSEFIGTMIKQILSILKASGFRSMKQEDRSDSISRKTCILLDRILYLLSRESKSDQDENNDDHKGNNDHKGFDDDQENYEIVELEEIIENLDDLDHSEHGNESEDSNDSFIDNNGTSIDPVLIEENDDFEESDIFEIEDPIEILDDDVQNISSDEERQPKKRKKEFKDK